MAVEFFNTPLPVSFMALLLCVSILPSAVSGATQIDVGLGENRFFVGERFLITFKDIVYGIAGVLMGLLCATTYLFISDFSVLSMVNGGKKATSSRKKGPAAAESNEVDDGATREARSIQSIGSRYPTDEEGRTLRAIDTEPETYVRRQGRLIGAKRLPTGMETRVLTNLESPENTFEQPDLKVEEEDDLPSAASRLFKILFSLPIGRNDSEDEIPLQADSNYFS